MKAIVVETRENEAAVLLKDGTFRIVNGRYKVGETIEYRKKTRPVLARWIAAAAVAILMLGTGGGFWYDANYVVYGEVSVDTDSSIVYSVNKQNRVLKVRAVNDDAAGIVDILEQDHIRLRPVSEVLERTFAIMGTGGEDETYVLINVSADNTVFQDRLQDEIEMGLDHVREQDPAMEVRIDRSDREAARRAAENGMSPGRYTAWERLGDGMSPGEFTEKPIREIMAGAPEDGGRMRPPR